MDEKLTPSCVCNTNTQTQRADLIRNADLIIWDELPMTHRYCVEALEKSLRDITRQNKLFGGKMAIELDGSKLGTNNGITDLIEMSRNFHHKEITSFRSRNLVSQRVGREMLESMPRATRSTPTPPGDAAPTETGVARDLAKTQNLIGLRRDSIVENRGHF